jgi:SAM-dependent methyltransferase
MRGRFIGLLLAMLPLSASGQVVPFVASPNDVVERMLKLARVSSSDIVYDLGCGDGRIVVAAAKEYGASGVGIDIDPLRIKEANYNAEQANVTDKVRFIVRDVFQSKFSDATVVYLYMLPTFNIQLRPRLLSELKPGTRIASYTFGIGDWQPDFTESTGTTGYDLYLWIVPAQIAGVWDCQLETPRGPRRAVLQLSQKYQQIAGSVTVNGIIYSLTDAKLLGDRLTFSLPLPGSALATKFTLTMSSSAPTTKPTTQPSANSRDLTSPGISGGR